jgi:uncharacterized protein YfaT (DUF1175 family)
MKPLILTALCTLALCLTTPLSTAQAQAQTQSHGNQEPELSTKQAAQLKAFFVEVQQEAVRIKDDPSTSQEEKVQRLQLLMTAAKEYLDSILTPEQRAYFQQQAGR